MKKIFFYSDQVINILRLFLLAGNLVLYPSMVVEKLGGREGVRSSHGPQSRHHLRG